MFACGVAMLFSFYLGGVVLSWWRPLWFAADFELSWRGLHGANLDHLLYVKTQPAHRPLLWLLSSLVLAFAWPYLAFVVLSEVWRRP